MMLERGAGDKTDAAHQDLPAKCREAVREAVGKGGHAVTDENSGSNSKRTRVRSPVVVSDGTQFIRFTGTKVQILTYC